MIPREADGLTWSHLFVILLNRPLFLMCEDFDRLHNVMSADTGLFE